MGPIEKRMGPIGVHVGSNPKCKVQVFLEHLHRPGAGV